MNTLHINVIPVPGEGDRLAVFVESSRLTASRLLYILGVVNILPLIEHNRILTKDQLTLCFYHTLLFFLHVPIDQLQEMCSAFGWPLSAPRPPPPYSQSPLCIADKGEMYCITLIFFRKKNNILYH